MQNRRCWTSQEDNAIQVIVEELGTKRWSEVSQLMKTQFALPDRSGKQCRERWHNHLAPDLNKKPWSAEEEAILFEAHRKFGNKWTEISKLVNGRTDNAIKNHFYSSVRRSLRRIGKILGTKNSTNKIRTIKPAVLSAMFNKSDCELPEEFRNLASQLFAFSQKKPKNKNSMEIEEKQNLQNLIRVLLAFNDQYQKNRGANNYQDKITANHPQEDQSDSDEDQDPDFEENKKLSKQTGKQISEQEPNPPITNKIPNKQSQYDWQSFNLKLDIVKSQIAKQGRNGMNEGFVLKKEESGISQISPPHFN